MKQFKDLNLNSNILKALDSINITIPTEIQQKAIPVLLNSDVDFHGQAQTGTGKTFAFGIPLMHKIEQSKRSVQALIVAPTRELVLQISDSLNKLLTNSDIRMTTIYGGSSMVKQMQDLRSGMHIVVGTPGRLNDHLRRKTLNLKDLKVLVLDEADIMLDMGFKEEVDEILNYCPKTKKTWLFSATVKQGINELKSKHMDNVVTVRVSQNNVGNNNTSQFYCVTTMGNRVNALCRVIDSDPEFYGFIFCPTKALTAEIAEKLSAHGYNINCLHGDMDQSSRTRVIQQFRDKKFSILIATDVAARGIDIPDITHVINFCLPNDQESYVHRIGRTGRAGKTGTAITFISNAELRKVRFLCSKFNVNISAMQVPTLDDVFKVQMQRIEGNLDKLVINTSNNNYLKQLTNLLSKYSQEQLNAMLNNLLNEKFFKKFEENSSDRQRRANQNDFVELEISLGSFDNVTQNDIRKLFEIKGGVTNEELSKVKVLNKKSFVIIPSSKLDAVMPLVKDQKLNGKRARIFVAKA